MRGYELAIALLVGCSGGPGGSGQQRTQADCDAIAEQIRTEAVKEGFATQGICNNPAAKNFAQACEQLHECNASLGN